MSRALTNETGSTGAGVAGIHQVYTTNPTSGPVVQVGNRLTIQNLNTATTTTTLVGQIIRIDDDDTSAANTIRGIEVVANVGDNNSATENTGIRTTGGTFGITAYTNAAAASSVVPAAIYGENTGTTTGDILRLNSTSMTSAPSFATFYQATSDFTGTGLLMDFGSDSGTGDDFVGNFIELRENDDVRFKINDDGKVWLTLDDTASNDAICGNQGNGTSGDVADVLVIDCDSNPIADYAEMYPVEADVEYGDIVAVGTELINTYDTTATGAIDWNTVKGQVTRLVKTTDAYQKNVIGIVSNNYSDFSSTGHNIKEEDNPMPVALNGRVPVKVAMDSTDIMPGDYLTTSGTEIGKATKATKAGQVIGKALEVWTSESGKATVMVYIEQGFYSGQSVAAVAGVTTTDTTFAKQVLQHFINNPDPIVVSELLSDRVVAGLELITPRVVADRVEVGGITIASDSGITLLNNQGQTAISFDTNGNAIFTGKITAGEIDAGTIRGLDVIVDSLEVLGEGQEAFALTASAVDALGSALGQQSEYLTELASAQDGVDARLALIESLFEGEVPTLTIDAVMAETLTVAGESTFSGETQFNGLTFFNNAATFAGPVSFGGEVAFEVPPLFNRDTAGFALIKEGDRRVEVIFEEEYAVEPIVNTTISFTEEDEIDDTVAGAFFDANIQSIVVEKSATGFTILLNKPAPRDIRFSWTALAALDATTFESVIEGLTIEVPPTPEQSPTPEPEQTPTPEPAPQEPPTEEPTPEPAPEQSPTPEPEQTPTPEPAPQEPPTEEPAPEPAPTQ